LNVGAPEQDEVGVELGGRDLAEVGNAFDGASASGRSAKLNLARSTMGIVQSGWPADPAWSR
jgi:hypothetical protein